MHDRIHRAVPKLIPVFDLNACITGTGRVCQPYLYVAAKESSYTRFIVKTMVEEQLRTDHFCEPHPRINLPGIRWDNPPLPVERDKLNKAGYSTMYVRPGFGPVIEWGSPGSDADPVHMWDLICIGSIIKTWVHRFNTDTKPCAASAMASMGSPDHYTGLWARLIENLSREVESDARNLRLAHGDIKMFTLDEESERVTMQWHSPYTKHRLLFNYSNFDIRIQVGRSLWFAFNNCFGPDVTYHLTTDFTEV